MRDFLWRLVAYIVTRPRVRDWLIRRAQRTPYRNITGPDGSLYMGRWWLFNPYEHGEYVRRFEWLPSIRIHHIMRADSDRHLHDHPWNARTIVLRSYYQEERPAGSPRGKRDRTAGLTFTDDGVRERFYRWAGYTGTLKFGQYHRICYVPAEGVWTMFWTWKKQGTWGFCVDGKKVPWREYLGEEESA